MESNRRIKSAAGREAPRADSAAFCLRGAVLLGLVALLLFLASAVVSAPLLLNETPGGCHRLGRQPLDGPAIDEARGAVAFNEPGSGSWGIHVDAVVLKPERQKNLPNGEQARLAVRPWPTWHWSWYFVFDNDEPGIADLD